MTRRLFVFGILALALTAMDGALVGAFGLYGSGLLFALGILFLAAFRAGDIEGAALAALIGYGWDVFAGTPTGLSVAPAVGVFIALRMLSQGVDCSGVAQLAVLGFLAALAHGLLCVALMKISGSAGELAFWPSAKLLLRQSVFAALLVPPVFKLAGWIDRLLVEDKSESEVWLS
ncbi:MAG: hypothetical protein ACOC0J_00165 [Myxococcota bacterium]